LRRGIEMIYIEAPNEFEEIEGKKSIFLAGGITNCPDWQSYAVKTLEICENLVVLNPRRENFPIEDPNASFEQISWEHNAIKKADAVLFWFAQGSLNPIVLFEYGKELGRNNKPLFVGYHPSYPRKQDVEIQTVIERPDQKIFKDLGPMLTEVMVWAEG
jgi:hypothetical protein